MITGYRKRCRRDTRIGSDPAGLVHYCMAYGRGR